MFPSFTSFSRSQPSNLLTVKDWKVFAEKAYASKDWLKAAKAYAAIQGGALILKVDGNLVAITKLASGKIRTTTFKPEKWGWA